MKLCNLVKALPLVLGASVAANVQAGVTATSYLEINDLFVEIDTDNDGVADTPPPGEVIITILDGTREGNTNANWNAISVGDTATDFSGVGTSNAGLVCAGPDCGALTGVGDDGRSLDLGNLINDTTSDYAYSDMTVTGSAIGSGATGYTYGDVGITGGSNVGSASSQIFNNLLTSLTLTVLSDVNIRFTALYDYFVDAIITPDLTSDGVSNATASAEASFSIILADILAPTVDIINDGLSFSDFAFDVPTLGDLVTLTGNDESFATGWVTLSAGTYQLEIAQDSDVQASIIPEPGSIALLGLGLFGAGMFSRRRG